MIQCRDQLGRQISLAVPAKRIVSLVPSITETLYDLGCGREVIGITKFCTHPDSWFRNKTRIGGTKTFHVDKIAALSPDLILANKEENDPDLVSSLMNDHRVWVSDVKSLDDTRDLISQLGLLTGRHTKAAQINSNIEAALASKQTFTSKKSVAYMIWKDPVMVAGGDTYINTMLELAGFENIFKTRSRYPEVSKEELKASNPEVVLLSSEPFPFATKHLDFFQNICPNAVILLIDGTYFSWYGSRLLPAISYFGNLQR